MKFPPGFASRSLVLSAAAIGHDVALLKRHHHVAHEPPPAAKPAYRPPANTSGSDTTRSTYEGYCNPIGATSKITAFSGPNGHIDRLNCGINGGGWSPPLVLVEELIVVPLEHARRTTFGAP
ncbi:hypothetical protein F5148DRAFT_1283226 [Russula earlei]|uniref:Uncharacterized protein n=1 Tax=Russula earlei TaxID=71964 RepID=A0ACC0UDI4_9AGAM|nr:hypothetical protein F5148DRAFT_1283226 [Russula earlei]